MTAEHADIYEHFFRMCPGIQFREAWDFLHPDDDCRFVNGTPGNLIEQLQQEFETDQLLASRLLGRTSNGRLRLNPRLQTQDRLIVALRNEQGHIFDAITSTGSLSDRWPLLLLRKDAVTKQAIQSPRRVFLTSTLVDAFLFRSLGLAATCVADVAHLTRLGLKRLLWLVGGYSDGPIRREPIQFRWEGQIMVNESGYVGLDENAPPEFELVLCAFSLYSFSREIPPNIASAARYLGRAETCLSIHWEGLSVWWPTVDEMANLAYRQELQSPDMLREFLTEEHELFSVVDFVDPDRPPASTDTLVHALEELDRALLDGEQHIESQHYLEKEREAFAKYEAQLEKTMIRPLMDSAIDLRNASIRPLRAQQAHVAKMLHMLMLRMHFVQNKRQHAGAGDVFPDESLKKIKELTELMIKLVKAEHALCK